jgi:hypothetical protein
LTWSRCNALLSGAHGLGLFDGKDALARKRVRLGIGFHSRIPKTSLSNQLRNLIAMVEGEHLSRGPALWRPFILWHDRDRQYAIGAQDAPYLAQTACWFSPEIDAVDSECPVKRLISVGERANITMHEIDQPTPDRSGIPSVREPHHRLREVNAGDMTVSRLLGSMLQRYPWAKAYFQDMRIRLDGEQIDRPARFGRIAACHATADQAPK